MKNPIAKGWDPSKTKSRDNSGESQRTNKDRKNDPPPNRGNSAKGHTAVRPLRRKLQICGISEELLLLRERIDVVATRRFHINTMRSRLST